MAKSNGAVRGFLLVLALFALIGAFSLQALADGDGSPDECETPYSATGDDDEMTYVAPAGWTITGVCIKSGANMFGGNKHSDPLTDGTYENECYLVEGVGTNSVTITRLRSGSDCQALSHVDVLKIFGTETTVPEETTLPEETTIPTETTVPEETTLPEETTIPQETTIPEEETTIPVDPTTVPDDSTTVSVPPTAVSESSTSAPEVLPFTGIPTGLLVLAASSLIGLGWLLVRSVRSQEG